MKCQDAPTTSNVVTNIITYNLTPFYSLFDSGATHSFMSPKIAPRLGLETKCIYNLYYINHPYRPVAMCNIIYKDCPLMLSQGCC